MNRYALTIVLGAALLTPAGAYAQRGRGAGSAAGGMGQPQRPQAMPRNEPTGMHEGKAQPGPAHAATVAAQLNAKPGLVQRLQPLLPQGMTIDAAAAGFKNQGQFVAALHVCQNLGIPFPALKDRMTGTAHDSLGDAIRSLRPETSASDVRQATRRAEQQAKADLQAREEKGAPASKDTVEPKESAQPKKQ